MSILVFLFRLLLVFVFSVVFGIERQRAHNPSN